MATKKASEDFLNGLDKRFEKEMVRVRKEISVYENSLAADKLTKKPQAAPQFSK